MIKSFPPRSACERRRGNEAAHRDLVVDSIGIPRPSVLSIFKEFLWTCPNKRQTVGNIRGV
eukprot:2200541-Prymnesium_polylepis.2